MSKENAERFLETIALHTELRKAFVDVTGPEDFVGVAGQLGYDFTPDEMKAVVQGHSRGVSLRRHTGVWEWLRTVPWMERSR